MKSPFPALFFNPSCNKGIQTRKHHANANAHKRKKRNHPPKRWKEFPSTITSEIEASDAIIPLFPPMSLPVSAFALSIPSPYLPLFMLHVYVYHFRFFMKHTVQKILPTMRQDTYSSIFYNNNHLLHTTFSSQIYTKPTLKNL